MHTYNSLRSLGGKLLCSDTVELIKVDLMKRVTTKNTELIYHP